MARSRSVSVGVFIITGVLLFGVGLFLIGKRQLLFENRVEFYVEFTRMGGLQPGALVRVSGRDAGEVLEIYEPASPDDRFLVKFEAVERLHPLIRTDSAASIQTEGIVGAKFLQIQAGSSAAQKAPPGFRLHGHDPVSISDLLEEAQSTIRTINIVIEEGRQEFTDVASSVADIAEEASKITVDIHDDIERTAEATARFMDHASLVARRLDEGEGTIGKLFRDPSLFNSLADAATDIRLTAGNARRATDKVDIILQEIDAKAVAADIRHTAQNVAEATDSIRNAVASFSARTSDGKLGSSFDQILTNAGEAMSDFAENMEALKRNWFFRGFFNRRGFFDIDAVSIEEYKKGEFAKNKRRSRFWQDFAGTFELNPGSSETLSDSGKQNIARIMADIWPLARSNAIMVEGYASTGTAVDQFESSRRRAAVVRKYLLEEFDLNPDYVGIVPMGKVAAQGGTAFGDGVAIILFTDK